MTESSCTTLANCFNTQSTDEDPWIGVETFGYIVKFELSIFDSANVAQELSIMLTPSHTESLQTLSCTVCVTIRGACVCVCAEVLVLLSEVLVCVSVQRCLCVCLCRGACVCVCAEVLVCVSVQRCLCVCLCRGACVCVCAEVHVCVSVQRCLCVCLCRGACVCVCAEVLVLGVGGRVQRVPENVKAYLRSKAIALEVSDTVRTYKCLSLNVGTCMHAQQGVCVACMHNSVCVRRVCTTGWVGDTGYWCVCLYGCIMNICDWLLDVFMSLNHHSPMRVPPSTFFSMRADKLGQLSSLPSFCKAHAHLPSQIKDHLLII